MQKEINKLVSLKIFNLFFKEKVQWMNPKFIVIKNAELITFHLSVTMVLIAFSFSYAVLAAIMERCAWYLLSSGFMTASKSTLLSKMPIKDLKFAEFLSGHDFPAI